MLQGSNKFKIVYVPKLKNPTLCPVRALQIRIRTLHLRHTDPLFMLNIKGSNKILTAFKVRSVLAQCIEKMGLYPQKFGFHVFASLAFNANVPLKYITLIH